MSFPFLFVDIGFSFFFRRKDPLAVVSPSLCRHATLLPQICVTRHLLLIACWATADPVDQSAEIVADLSCHP